MEIQEDELSVMRSCRDFGLGVMKLHHFRGFSACVLLKVALKDAQCPHLGWVEQDRDPLESCPCWNQPRGGHQVAQRAGEPLL